MPILGHGVDIVQISRIESMLDDHGERFATRCFTPGEQTYCEESVKVKGERYSARFGAKEAVLKALGTGLRYGLEFTQIEVVRNAEGAPQIVLSGKAAEMAQKRGIRSWHVSLSHAGEYAIASVIAED